VEKNEDQKKEMGEKRGKGRFDWIEEKDSRGKKE
jgi:hypothetical protein